MNSDDQDNSLYSRECLDSIPNSGPDLFEGYILNGINAENTWMTRIQSILVENEGRNTQKISYLSQECRRENVPFSSGPLGGGTSIFKLDTPLEFLTFTQGDNFFQVFSSDGIFDGSHIEAFNPTKIGKYVFFKPVTYPEWCSSVHCAWKTVTPVSTAHVLDLCRENPGQIHKTILKITWTDEHKNYALYLPIPYLNFAHPQLNKNNYVQSITGTVLTPLKDSYSCAYLSCAADTSGKGIIEIAYPLFVSSYELIKRNSQMSSEAGKLLNALSSILPSYSRYYGGVTKVKGTYTFLQFD